jgi:uncharacterized protein (DUF1697 family)
MTPRFCFLRAINVGKRRVAMADLSAALAAAGLRDVETFIASGNFVFSGDATESQIEAVIQARFGFLAEAFVRTAEELATLYALTAPLAQVGGVHAVHVGFLSQGPDDALKEKFAAAQNPLDDFSFGPKEVIWTAYDRVSETPFGKKGMTGKGWPTCTFRNVTTVEKMLTRWG